MYQNSKMPFYMAFPNLNIMEEQEQKRDLERMKALYPQTAITIQEKVDRLCDLMEYEGSRMYDEYPDKYVIERMAGKIADQIEAEQVMAADFNQNQFHDLICVLLYQEMCQRRCRHRRCRGHYYIGG